MESFFYFKITSCSNDILISRSRTSFASGWSPDDTRSPYIHNIFLIVSAHPPSKSDCIAILFLSLVVNYEIGSMSFSRIEETTKEDNVICTSTVCNVYSL